MIDVRTRAVIEANRQLYRELQVERDRAAGLERKVASLTSRLREARNGRDLWRHRCMLRRSAGAKVDFDTLPPRAGRNPPLEFASSKSTIAESE